MIPGVSRHLDRARAMALVPLAALAVHQLRYWLAYGPKASRELLEQGHSYLHSVTPWIVLAAGLGLGALLAQLSRAWRSGRAGGPRGRRLLPLWALAALGLLLLYSGQELLEGLFATGHPAGLTGIFGDGGVWAIPAALAVGGVLALAVRGGRAAVRWLATRRTARLVVRLFEALRITGSEPDWPRCAPLADRAAGRAPPAGALVLG